MAAERGDSVTKLQKVCCVILSLCFFGLLVLMPGDFFLDGNVYRQLPLYCFLEEEASGVSMRDDPETYARLARSNAKYLEAMVEQENQAELGEDAKNRKATGDRHSQEGESAEDIFKDLQEVQADTAMTPSAVSEPMATTSPTASSVPTEGELQGASPTPATADIPAPVLPTEAPDNEITPSTVPTEPSVPAEDITSSAELTSTPVPADDITPSAVPTVTPVLAGDVTLSVTPSATSEPSEDVIPSNMPATTLVPDKDTTPSAAPIAVPLSPAILTATSAPVEDQDPAPSVAPTTTPVPTEGPEVSAAPTTTSAPVEDTTSPATPAATSVPAEATSSPSSPTATPAAQSASAGIGAQPRVDLAPERLADFDYLLGNFFIVDPNTAADQDLLSAARFLGNNLTIKKDPSVPQILLYHSHSQEAFADSREGETEDTIVGVGNYLEKLLTETYGYCVIHVTEAFDLAGGELDRSKAYDYARSYIENVLKENPSIEVVIDLHRDGVPENRRLVTTVNGKPTAQLMFYNGLSYTRSGGNVSYLPNPYIQDNLAFSFQMEYQAAQYYPDLYRGIYLAGLRYNLHLRKRSVLLEAGAQTNTVQEVKNAMEPFADLLNRVLTGNKEE